MTGDIGSFRSRPLVSAPRPSHVTTRRSNDCAPVIPPVSQTTLLWNLFNHVTFFWLVLRHGITIGFVINIIDSNRIPKRRMSVFDVEGLIRLVKKYEFIYNISNNRYKNARLKMSVWKNIAEKLGTNYETVRHKWKTIRDGYMKYKKQVQLAEGTGKKVIEYVWSSQLAFLDNYHVSRKGKKLEQPQTLVLEQAFEEASSSSDSPLSDRMLEEGEVPIKRRRSIEKGQVDHILNIVNQQNTKQNDAVDHLFMSYAETFKRFSPRQQAGLKIELAKLFSNAELDELNRTEDSSPRVGGTAEFYNFIKEEIR